MPSPTLDALPDGSLVVVADTTEEALGHVGRRLGHDALISEARRVHRGGWKGFFAHESVQLTARPRSGPTDRGAEDEQAAPQPPATTTGATLAGGDHGLSAALSHMTRLADDEERSFRDVLVGQLDADTLTRDEPAAPPPPPPAVTPAPTPTVTPAPASRAPFVASGTDWHVEHLRALRLPSSLIDACHGLDPDDDIAWVAAISAAVSTWCRPLPAGDSVLVGPRAHRLGTALALPVAKPGEIVAATGPVGLRVVDTDEQRAWVDEVAGDRWRHLVAGGRGWHGLLLDDALAVSWVGDEALPGALCLAGRLGLVLGYGLGTVTGRTPVRASPVDVALTIRSLLPRRRS